MTQQFLLPHIYPKEMKTYGQDKTCIRMFIAALFMITQNWKIPITHHQKNEQIMVYSQWNTTQQ